MKIKKGDTVKVLTGKDAGRQGNVLKVLPQDQKVVVDGVNIYKKHMKGDGQKKKSAIIDIAKPLEISNVMLVCPSCEKTARIAYEMKGKKKVRICRKCNEGIDEKKVAERSESKKKDSKKKTSTKKKETKRSVSKKSTSKKTTETKSKSTTKKK